MPEIKDPTYTVYKKGGNVEKKLPAKDAKSIAVDIEKIEFDIRKDIKIKL